MCVDVSLSQELRGERKNRAFYSDEEEDSEEDTGPVGGSLLCQDLDHDLQMLLKACQPLLRSRNSSVRERTSPPRSGNGWTLGDS